MVGSGGKKRQAAAATDDLLDRLLADKDGDEKKGAEAARGFGYQQWWGALVVTELLAQPDDFAVGMEVKQDVIVLDSSVSPTAIEFCQVKKNERAGGWKLKDLHAPGTKRKDSTRDISHLSKLYQRRKDFAGHPTKLRFVSNLSVAVANEAGRSASIDNRELSTLSEVEQTAIRKRIGEDIGIDPVDVDLSMFALHRTDLPLGQSYIFVAGKLVELSDNGCLPFPLAQPSVVARLLQSELQGKSSSTSYARDFEELKARLMTRREAMDIIRRVSDAQPPIAQAFNEGFARLNVEGAGIRELRAMRAERATVLTHATDRTNAQFKIVSAEIVAAVDTALDQSDDSSLSDLIREAVQIAKGNAAEICSGFSDGYLRNIALLVTYGGINIDVLHIASRSKPEDGL